MPLDGQSPSRFTNGRVGRLEEQFLRAHRRRPRAWRPSTTPRRRGTRRAQAVDAGRPALLLTDLYYLDHYGRSAHFPGHAVILAGYDDEVAYLSDTGFEDLQTTKLEHLAEARHGSHPVFPLDGQMLTVADPGALRDPHARRPGARSSATHGR